MKKNKIKIIVLISLIVFLGMFVISIINYSSASAIIKDDILNITRLTSTSIYSEINIELIKPIFVSLTMANDQFLKDWIKIDKEQDLSQITKYLSGIKDKYGYDSVFFVSAVTSNYYHYNGILKQVSTEDLHDVWFYTLIEKDVEYDLDIDTNQADRNLLTFFVNCKIFDDDGNVLGVTGTGVEMSRISQMFSEYNESQDVDIYLVDKSGSVQIHADESYIRNYNIFEDDEIASFEDDILSEEDNMQVFELQGDNGEEYLITRYIEELGWYLVVKKDTLILRKMFRRQLVGETAIFAILLFSILFIIGKVISRFQNNINKLASTDTLTGLVNRRIFDDYLKDAMEDAMRKNTPLTLVIFDIDNFKQINDTYGHTVGDSVLQTVADNTMKIVRTEDMLARWGGDEFAIVFHCALDDAKKIVDRIVETYPQDELLYKHTVKVSFGMTELIESDTTDSIMKRADVALYNAKKEGKNRVCWQ